MTAIILAFFLGAIVGISVASLCHVGAKPDPKQEIID
jgi:hypothetical protein